MYVQTLLHSGTCIFPIPRKDFAEVRHCIQKDFYELLHLLLSLRYIKMCPSNNVVGWIPGDFRSLSILPDYHFDLSKPLSLSSHCSVGHIWEIQGYIIVRSRTEVHELKFFGLFLVEVSDCA